MSQAATNGEQFNICVRNKFFNMEDTDDLELSDQDPSAGSTQSVRKNISLKLKPSPKGKAKGKKTTRPSKKPAKKAVVEDDTEEETAPKDEMTLRDEVRLLSSIKPTAPLEPLHQSQRLRWSHKVNVVGEKVVDPLIHCCEKCTLPILIYGRMIPCKHVFCLDCAKKTEKICPRCLDVVHRIEPSALGTVFVCTFGGTKHGVSGCRRTYLSPRDLKAHIDHRHLKPLQVEQPRTAIPEYKTHAGVVPMEIQQQQVPPPPPPQQHAHHETPMYHTRPPQDEAARHMHHPPPQHPPLHLPPPQHAPQHAPQPPPGHPPLPPPPHPQAHQPPPQQHMQTRPPPTTVESYQTIPVMSTSRSGNLITVPIQDEVDPYRRHQEQQQQAGYPLPQGHQPPPGYVPQVPPPQQYHTQHAPTHSGGPPYANPPTGPYSSHPNPPTPQGVLPPMSLGARPPMSQPPPMTSSAAMTLPAHHLGGPPPRQPVPHGAPPPPGGPPPPRYPSPHTHYDEQHPHTPPYIPPGGHSPRTPWGNAGPGPQPRGPPPPRAPTSTSSMTSMPPPRSDGSHYKQYYQ